MDNEDKLFDSKADQALDQIRLITMTQMDSRMVYKRIPELNDLMEKVKAGHDKLLAEKREELLEIVRQCMEEIHTTDGGDMNKKFLYNCRSYI